MGILENQETGCHAQVIELANEPALDLQLKSSVLRVVFECLYNAKKSTMQLEVACGLRLGHDGYRFA